MGNLTEIYGEVFNTDRDDARTGFDAMPAGWYDVQVDNAEIKTTKAGTGKYLAVELTVIGEHFAGRKLWPRLNLVNPNPKAEEIGQRELAALGQACGLMALQDTDELLGKTIQVRVKVKQDEGREPSNDVNAYRPTEGAQQPVAARPPIVHDQRPATTHTPPARPQQAQPAPTAPKPAGKRPWEK